MDRLKNISIPNSGPFLTPFPHRILDFDFYSPSMFYSLVQNRAKFLDLNEGYLVTKFAISISLFLLHSILIWFDFESQFDIQS